MGGCKQAKRGGGQAWRRPQDGSGQHTFVNQVSNARQRVPSARAHTRSLPDSSPTATEPHTTSPASAWRWNTLTLAPGFTAGWRVGYRGTPAGCGGRAVAGRPGQAGRARRPWRTRRELLERVGTRHQPRHAARVPPPRAWTPRPLLTRCAPRPRLYLRLLVHAGAMGLSSLAPSARCRGGRNHHRVQQPGRALCQAGASRPRSPPGNTERRQFARVHFASGAELITTQGTWLCQVVDISLKGVLQLPEGAPQWGMPPRQTAAVHLGRHHCHGW